MRWKLGEEGQEQGQRRWGGRTFGKAGAYELGQGKELLPFVGEVDVGDGNLPAGVAAGDSGAEGAGDDLVAEADADEPYAVRVECLAGVGSESAYPVVVIEGVVARPGEQEGVDIGEGRVRGRVVDDVVGRDGGEGAEILWRGKRLARGREEGGEDAAVGSIAGHGFGLGGVAREYGEAHGPGWRGAHGDFSRGGGEGDPAIEQDGRGGDEKEEEEEEGRSAVAQEGHTKMKKKKGEDEAPGEEDKPAPKRGQSDAAEAIGDDCDAGAPCLEEPHAGGKKCGGATDSSTASDRAERGGKVHRLCERRRLGGRGQG